MKKFLLILCTLIFLGFNQVGFAQQYTNYDYNFTINFPDGWKINEVNNPNDKNGFNIKASIKTNDLFGIILVYPKVENIGTEGATPDNSLTAWDRKKVLDEMIQGVKDRNSNTVITYSGYEKFRNNGFLILKTQEPPYQNKTFRVTYANTFIGGTSFFIIFMTLGDNTYWNEFSNTLNSLSTL